jgi:hypothetical protein
VALPINLYCTLLSLPALDFEHQLLGQRDRTDPELGKHLHGFMGFVMKDDRPMTATRFAVLNHLQRVRHHLSLEIEEDAFDGLARWAIAANAVLFFPDGTVRDPVGHVLVDPETGEAEPDAAVPYPDDAHARKQGSETWLSERGIPFARSLPPSIGVDEVELRTPQDVLRRAMALLAVSVRAESLASDDPLPVGQLRARLPIGIDALSPSEQAFLHNDQPEQQAIVNHAWRYECVWLFEWALGLQDELPPPTEICDVPRTAQTLLDADGDALLHSARLRSSAEVLDALDLHRRINWSIREAARTQSPGPEGIEAGVVAERHYALNWLVRYQNAAWDDVDTPT